MQGQQVLQQDAAAAALLRVAAGVGALLRGAAAARGAAGALGVAAGDEGGRGGGLQRAAQRSIAQHVYACDRAGEGGSCPSSCGQASGGWWGGCALHPVAPQRSKRQRASTGGAGRRARTHLGVKGGVLVVGAAAAAAGGAGHVCHCAACVDNDCKLLGGGAQVQGCVEVAAGGGGEGGAVVGRGGCWRGVGQAGRSGSARRQALAELPSPTLPSQGRSGMAARRAGGRTHSP